MIIRILICILCVSSFLAQTSQQRIEYGDRDGKETIQFDELLFDWLSFLQQKIMENTSTDEDMHVLLALVQFIVKMKELKNDSAMKEQTVYWLSRQGR